MRRRDRHCRAEHRYTSEVNWTSMQTLIRRTDRARTVLLAAAIVTTTSGTGLGQTPGEPRDEQTPPAWTPGATRTIRLFPAGDIYPVYVADPHRPTNTISEGFHARTRVPDASSPRTSLAAGGRFGMLRIGSRAPGGRFWQVSIEAGLDAIFDAQFRNDALGWDGNYGLTVTTATSTSPLAFKVALLHLSAHLGDEYEERTQTP